MTRGPVWGATSEDLNATKLVWPAGEQVAEHVADRDVVYVVLRGSARLSVDGTTHELSGGEVLIVNKGTTRSLVAGADGVEYVTAHRRRESLQIRPAPGQSFMQ